MFPVSRIARSKQFVQVYLCRPRATLSEVGLVLLHNGVATRSRHRESLEHRVLEKVVRVMLRCVSAVRIQSFHMKLDILRIHGAAD